MTEATAVHAPTLEHLLETVREAASARTPLSIRGGGTKAWYGHRVAAPTLDTRGLVGIVDYEPSELVMVARAGTPLREIEAVLGRHRQMLAFEPPHFTPTRGNPAISATSVERSIAAGGREATLGGCVAAGLSGPRRIAAGSVRDFVLGARLVDGRAQHLAFGGKVIKNVAGYDVSRALAGSLGTLGVITEVALKVLPQPAQRVTLALAMDEATALAKLNEWAGMPVAITASAWRPDRPRAPQGRLLVRLEGSEAAVQSGIRCIGGLDVEDGDAWWLGLREQTDPFFSARIADTPIWRVALPSVAPPLDAARLAFDDQLIEWGGALRWIASQADATVIRDAAASLGGHATLWRASDEMKARHRVFTPLAATAMTIQRRLQAEFDPHGIFNPGRMY